MNYASLCPLTGRPAGGLWKILRAVIVATLCHLPLAAVAALSASIASASEISFGTSAPAYDMVTVGNAGNAANPSAPSSGAVNVAAQGGGSVSYVFDIGATEVSNAQYAYFLNSVAKTDTNNLYNLSMLISRTGSPGSYSYAATGTNGNRPVGFVSALDTFRFANWLQNGMPTTGVQDTSTTELGAYNMALSQPTRLPGATFWVPSVNEWYKAAFYNPSLNGGLGGYNLYPVTSDSISPGVAPGSSTSANIASAYSTQINVGSYTTATSFYGAFDMAGNVAERLDTVRTTGYTFATSWFMGTTTHAASNSSSAFNGATIGGEQVQLGFRVAAVPEPATWVIGAAGLACAAGRTASRREPKAARRRRTVPTTYTIVIERKYVSLDDRAPFQSVACRNMRMFHAH